MKASLFFQVTSQAMSVMLNNITIRPAVATDADQLLTLMKKLAEFELYDDDFCVTIADLLERGFRKPVQFNALVAVNDEAEIIGMAVYYFIPFTYDLAPDAVLKELYVLPDNQGNNVGTMLMQKLVSISKKAGCKRIKWLVLSGNNKARDFYHSIGASQDMKWENWILTLADIAPLEGSHKPC